jgi:hypothetical protein
VRFVTEGVDVTADTGALNGRRIDLPIWVRALSRHPISKWIIGFGVGFSPVAFWGCAPAVCANTPAAAAPPSFKKARRPACRRCIVFFIALVPPDRILHSKTRIAVTASPWSATGFVTASGGSAQASPH